MSSRSCFRASRVRNVAVRVLALSVALSAVAAASADTFVWTAGLNDSSTNWYSHNWLQSGVNTGNTPYGDDVYLNNASDYVYTNSADSFAFAGNFTSQGRLDVVDGGTFYTSTNVTLTGLSSYINVSGTHFDGTNNVASTAYLNYDGGTLDVNGGTLQAFDQGIIISYADTILNQNLGYILAQGSGSTVTLGGDNPFLGTFDYALLINTGSGTLLGAQAGGSMIATTDLTDNSSGASIFATGEDLSVPGTDSHLQLTANNIDNHDVASIYAASGGQVTISTGNFHNYYSGGGGGQVYASGQDSLGNASNLTIDAGGFFNDGGTVKALAGGSVNVDATIFENVYSGVFLADGGVLNATAVNSALNDTATISAVNAGTLTLNSYSLTNALNGQIGSSGFNSTVALSGYSLKFDGTGSNFLNTGLVSADSQGKVLAFFDTIVNDGALGQGSISSSTQGTVNLQADTSIANINAGLITAHDNANVYIRAYTVTNASGSILVSAGDAAYAQVNASEFDNLSATAYAGSGGELYVSATNVLNDSGATIGALGNSTSGFGSNVVLDSMNVSNTNGSLVVAELGGNVSLTPKVSQFYNDATSQVLAFNGGTVIANNYLAENAGLIQADNNSRADFNLASTTGGSLDHGTFFNDPSGNVLATHNGLVTIYAQQTYNYGTFRASAGELSIRGNQDNLATSYVQNDGTVLAELGGLVFLGSGLGDTVVNNGDVATADNSTLYLHGYFGGGTTVNNGTILASGLNSLVYELADVHTVGASGTTQAFYGGTVNIDNLGSGLGTAVVNHGSIGALDGGTAASNGYATSFNVNTTSSQGSLDNHNYYFAMQGGVVNDYSNTWHNAPEGYVSVGGGSEMNLKTGGTDNQSHWNQGFIQVSNGSALSVTNGSNVALNSGTISVDSTSSASYSAYLVQTSNFDGQSGTIVDKGTISALVVQLGYGGADDGGTLTGNGVVDANLYNLSGLVKPGDATSLTVTHNFNQTSRGILEMSIEGLAGAGVAGGNDVLLVGQNANLDGALNLDFAPGYTAAAGDTFYVLLTGGMVNGAFASVNSLGLTPGYFAQAVYDPSDVRIQIAAVPEPTTLAVMGLGLLALARRRRKSA